MSGKVRKARKAVKTVKAVVMGLAVFLTFVPYKAEAIEGQTALSRGVLQSQIVQAKENDTTDTSSDTRRKEGLIEEDGHYRCYEDGELVKGRWVEIDGETYYFKKTGNAPVGSHRIKGTYYIFNEKGQLLKPKAKKVVRVKNAKGKTKRYQVNSNGTAAKGWSKDKVYYADKTGAVATGITVLKETFYVFQSNGKYNKEGTKELRKLAKYEKPFAPIKGLIGKPEKSEYYASCYGDGKDGMLTYDGFTVFTYQPKQGEEIFMGVE